MPDNEPKNHIPPLKKSDEIALAFTRGLISELPGGGLLLEVGSVVVPERYKRFFRATKSDLAKLIEAGKVTQEDLMHNENFHSVLLSAAMIAVRNHQEEKLEMLRNAVLNAALPDAPEDDIQAMYLSYLDRLTPWHVRILKFFDIPRERSAYIEGVAAVLEKEFPDLQGKSSFCMSIMADLESLNLITNDLTGASFTKYAERSEDNVITTNSGREVLKYIASPLDKP